MRARPSRGHSNSRWGILKQTIGQTLPRLAHLKETPAALIQELLERSGVLREPEHDHVDFIHRTFMEYMGARAGVAMNYYGLMVDRLARRVGGMWWCLPLGTRPQTIETT
jgi:hypothetical protein